MATHQDVGPDLAKNFRLSKGIEDVILNLEVLSHGQEDSQGELVRFLVLDARLSCIRARKAGVRRCVYRMSATLLAYVPFA